MLSMAKKDLLLLNFEGILKYFRVQLPKRYRNQVAARQLMKLTSSFKLRKLKKYEKDFLAIKVGWYRRGAAPPHILNVSLFTR